MSTSREQTITKSCSLCKNDLPLDSFRKSQNGKYGRRSHCKMCEKDKLQEKTYTIGGKAFVVCAGCGSKISAGLYGLMREPYCKQCIPNISPAPWSIELKYLAGLVAADGTLESGGDHRIGFNNTDPNLMKTFLYLIQSPRIASVHEYDNPNHKPAHNIYVRDRGYYNLFVKVGLIPRKSLCLGEVDLPRGTDGKITDFFLFVRGAFEGDGSISHAKAKSANMTISSGSKNYLVWLRKEIAVSLDDPEIIQNCSISDPKAEGKNPELYLRMQYVPVLYKKMYLDYDNTKFSLPFLKTTVSLKTLGLPYKRARLEYWVNKHK
jgi:hypothetical protein